MNRHRDVDWRPSAMARCRIGADVARFGGDTTQVATHFDGFGVRDVVGIPPMDLMDCAAALYNMAQIEDIRGHVLTEVRVDSDGLGAGVFDRLAQLLPERAVSIRNGVKAQDTVRFFNSRSEMLWHLREAIDPRGANPIALPPDDDLREELRHFRWNLRPDGRVQVESKDDMKARLGRSPDKADACAYAVCRLDVAQADIVFY
jgi:hypothetical protein